jgi:hypothetical protein
MNRMARALVGGFALLLVLTWTIPVCCLEITHSSEHQHTAAVHHHHSAATSSQSSPRLTSVESSAQTCQLSAVVIVEPIACGSHHLDQPPAATMPAISQPAITATLLSPPGGPPGRASSPSLLTALRI